MYMEIISSPNMNQWIIVIQSNPNSHHIWKKGGSILFASAPRRIHLFGNNSKLSKKVDTRLNRMNFMQS